MSSAVAELDNTLTSMLALKAGVSGAKINAMTSLCNANVKDEPVLIQKLYAHFKKAEPSKKLGVLYVIDSVTRQWVEQARKAGQTIGHGARDGTYAAGVTHVSELLPALMQDIISVMPDEQREKLQKLIMIWEKGNTFSPHLLHSFKEKLDAPPAQSTTPTSTPPPQAMLVPKIQEIPASGATTANPAQSTSSILASLQALAAASKNASAAQASTQAPSQTQPAATPYQYQTPPIVSQSIPQMPSIPAVNQPTVMPPGFFPPPPPGMFNQGAQVIPPPAIPGPPQDNPVLQQQIRILQTLQAQGVPQSDWPKILAAMSNLGAPPVPPPGFVPPMQQQSHQNGQSFSGLRSPAGDRNGRDRSRSPRGRLDASPIGRRRSPDRSQNHGRTGIPPPGPRWIEFDNSIPQGNIKVFSRTLFVGGVNCSDKELERLFSQAGTVQTCVTNAQKRHGFVKMFNRKDAENALKMFEHFQTGDMTLRTRWGVGFGPRDASNYQTGISIINLERLTEADRKWLTTADYGGTGGRDPESGMCVEEPDIEIGAGVSSKAISRRMQTDRSGTAGPRSSRVEQPRRQNNHQNNYQNNQYHNGQQNYNNQRSNGNTNNENNTPAVQVPPTVPSFGFQFPPNFSMPNGTR